MKKKKVFSKAVVTILTVTLMLAMIPGAAFADAGTDTFGKTEETAAAVPTEINITADGIKKVGDKFLLRKDDKFFLKASDQNGKETPVKWYTTSAWACKVDEDTGEVTVTQKISQGSTTFMYFNAVSTLDSNIKSNNLSVVANGYELSDIEVVLSEDGQNAKTAKMTGGLDGYNEWTYDADALDGIASLVNDAGAGSSIEFNCYRPGSFDVTVRVDKNESLKDTKKVTIKGVAVEAKSGDRQKTYLSIGKKEHKSCVELVAFCESDTAVSEWASSNEAVATVDKNGVVTAHKVGVAVITAKAGSGAKGGIKVVVESSDKPYFEGLEFMTGALENNAWVNGKTFDPLVMNYNLTIKRYNTSTLTLQKETLYNASKYDATAIYKDINGITQNVTVNNGELTLLKDIPFGNSEMKIVLSDKTDKLNKTEYVFNVIRPRDDANSLMSSNNRGSGITLIPEGRELSAVKYKEKPEGTFFVADSNGVITSGTGISENTEYYRTYVFDNLPGFRLSLKGKTDYVHIRYSLDDGKKWNEVARGGAVTEEIKFPAQAAGNNPEVKVMIQVISDECYHENIAADKDGFDNGASKVREYAVWAEQLGELTEGTQILEAKTAEGTWYPEFKANHYNYTIIVPDTANSTQLYYKAAEGAVVKVGSDIQDKGEDGLYKLELSTSPKKIAVTSAKGAVTEYSFKLQKKSRYDVPDQVTDYLCINSQYTNGGYGIAPEATLSGLTKSLGNFGGYITYYYEEGLKDLANNPYGVDFYVYGNSFANGGSAAESGQVWVSEDGSTWYALAGSEHYENSTIWDYQVTYRKAPNGKTSWEDNRGNSNDGSSRSGSWPAASNYYLNNLVGGNEITLSGILLPCVDGTIQGDHSTGSFAGKTSFGYADYFSNGSIGANVNPYAEAASSNGFDLKWAVDRAGEPVDVRDKEFHYVKIVTASNIWAGGFNEKSTEVSQVVRTTANNAPVGMTTMAESVNITDGIENKTVALNEKQQIYKIDLGDMKYVNISLEGAPSNANIYVNNKRIGADDAASGIKVTKEDGEKLVRIIMQEGEKEPQLIILKLTSSAAASDELIEGIKINVAGAGRKVDTADGKTYTTKVGHKISRIGILPVTNAGITYTVNDEAPLSEYTVKYGENNFRISADDGKGKTQAINLKVIRENAPQVSDQKIKVNFVLYGDEKHGDNGVKHTYQNNGASLPVWVKYTTYEIPAGATVLDVFDKAMKENNIPYVNKGGNYISEVNGLSEYDNGSLSGWMYLLNGTHPAFGVAEQVLRNGDSIVFHYTDDYTKEEGSEKWPTLEENSSPVTTSGIAGSAVTTTPTEVSIKGDTAKVTVKPENMAEAIRQAKENKSKKIVLDVKASAVKGAARLETELDTSAVKQLVRDTSSSFVIASPLGRAEITAEILSSIASKAKGAKITFEISQTADKNIELTVKSANEVLYTMNQKAEEDSKDEIRKIKGQLKQLNFAARSVRTKKNNVIVRLKLDERQKEILKQIEAAGYNVKYHFYRSEVKNNKYQSRLRTEGERYVNTAGKYGKSYYYKARIQVYDADGKLVAKTALTQCKYASRVWNR